MLVFAVLIGNKQRIHPSLRLLFGRHVSNLGVEHAFDTGQLLVNHVRRAVGSPPHRSATGRHAVADQLLAAEGVKQLKLQRVGVCAVLRQRADDDRFDTEYRPVVEIDVHARRRHLQHVAFFNGRKPAASIQVGADDLRYVQRQLPGLTLPAERHDRDRTPLDALRNDDIEFRHGDIAKA